MSKITGSKKQKSVADLEEAEVKVTDPPAEKSKTEIALDAISDRHGLALAEKVFSDLAGREIGSWAMRGHAGQSLHVVTYPDAQRLVYHLQ